MTQTEFEFFKEYQESAAGVQKFLLTYADYLSDVKELSQLKALFTTDCLINNMVEHTYEADCLLDDIWNRTKDVILENPDYLESYKNKDHEQKYCKDFESYIYYAFEKYMYQDVI